MTNAKILPPLHPGIECQTMNDANESTLSPLKPTKNSQNHHSYPTSCRKFLLPLYQAFNQITITNKMGTIYGQCRSEGTSTVVVDAEARCTGKPRSHLKTIIIRRSSGAADNYCILYCILSNIIGWSYTTIT